MGSYIRIAHYLCAVAELLVTIWGNAAHILAHLGSCSLQNISNQKTTENLAGILPAETAYSSTCCFLQLGKI